MKTDIDSENRYISNLKKSKQKGITIIALVITLVVILILVGIVISVFREDDTGVINKATDGQIMTELSQLQEKLNKLKTNGETERLKDGDYSGTMNNEDLKNKGIIKNVYIKNLNTTLGVINLDKLGVKSKLGNNGKNINVKEVENLQDINIQDVFAIDINTNTVYYIRGNVWSMDGQVNEYDLKREEETPVTKPQISVTPETYSGKDAIKAKIIVLKGTKELSRNNKYEYYLSSEKTSLKGGQIKEYKSEENILIGEYRKGEHYLLIKQIKDIEENRSIGGTIITIDGEEYHEFGPYTFDNDSLVQYKIEYELAGGTANNPTTFNKNTPTFTLNSPTRTGYNFNGWTGSNGSTPQKIVTIEQGSRENRKYTANWIDNIPPTVTLNPNGGNGSISDGQNKATIKTTLYATDDGSGLNNLQYAWSTSNTTEPTSWTTFKNGQEVSKTDCTAGNYYLWTKVTDKAGNRAETVKVSNSFKVTSSLTGGSTKYIKKGGTVTLTATKGGQAGEITWTTSNSSGASLNITTGNTVTVTGVVAGTYTVTATESVGNARTSYTIEVTQLTTGGSVTVLEGNTVTLNAPTKSGNCGTVTYKVTAGTDYATVNSTTGVVTGKEALAEKTIATVTATESNGKATCTYAITIKVWNGNGLLADPYQITNLRDIQKLSIKTNKTSDTINYAYTSRYFKQTANINLGGSSNENWTPIGKDATRFNGTYDGGNYTITGLYISDEIAYRGLFGTTNTNSNIKNLTISNGNVTTTSGYSSMCVGLNRGQIENVKIVGGTVKGGIYVGGIAGSNLRNDKLMY